MARKKVLFLTVPMKGHVVHTLQLVEWFLQYPDDYEVHVHGEKAALENLPSGAVAHVAPPPPGRWSMHQAFCEVLEGSCREPDWYSSQAYMLSSLSSGMKEATIGHLKMGIDRVKEVCPDVVVADHGYNFKNFLYTSCKTEGIPVVLITSMGRPETLLDLKNLIMMLMKHFSAVRTAMGVLGEIEKELTEQYGKPLPERDAPVGIFPSSELLVQGRCPPKQIYVGPFISQPDPTPASPEESWAKLDKALADLPELARWLREGGSTPVVYVAFGTIVKVNEDLVNRLVEGLSGGNWRVLWSLPSSQQNFLPKGGLSEQWFVESFVPQFALLESGRIAAFLSHCGANSTQESLVQGVPMICMPFYGDQYEWAESVSGVLGAGVKIDKLQSRPDAIRRTVAEVLEKPTYRASARALAQEMRALSLKRLEFLVGKTPHPFTISPDLKVGIPVAAAIVDACLRGDDPQSVVTPATKARTPVCWACQ